MLQHNEKRLRGARKHLLQTPVYPSRICTAVRRHALLCALVILAGTGVANSRVYAQTGSEPVTVTDLLKIRELGNVNLSPDGRQVIYSVRSIVQRSDASSRGSLPESQPEAGLEMDYEYRSHLYLADPIRPAENRQLTRGDQSATQPAWHPDGDRIAFVRSLDGTPQIFILPLLGGEAYPVTSLESGASDPRWSPDGRRLLFASNLTSDQIRRRTNDDPDWPSERPGRGTDAADNVTPDPDGSVEEIRAWLDANAAEQRPRVFHRLNFLGETDLKDAPTFRHWFMVEPDSQDAEPRLITRGYYDFKDAAWMADGAQVIVSGMMRADRHPDRIWETELYAAAADGSGIQPFFAVADHSVSDPVVSPDGNVVAFLAYRIDHAGYAQGEIGVVPIDDTSAARLLTLDFDRSASAPRWSPDGWHVYFTAASDGGFPLYRVPAFDGSIQPDTDEGLADEMPDTTAAAADSVEDEAPAAQAAVDVTEALMDSIEAGTADVPTDSATIDVWQPVRDAPRVERLTPLHGGIRSFDVGTAAVYYVATEVANPYELFVSESPFTTARRLTDHNAAWLAAKRLSIPEAYTLTRDSLEIQYWIMKPSFFDPAQRYPLLLQIHGGPSAMWGPGEATMWHEFQFFASRGYGVIFSNPRGSGGYGYDFERANYQDWGSGPAGDVLAVATEAAAEPWLDAERQVVTGGSYAGYLTAWIVGHDHRFEAAVAQRGVYDLGTFLGEGNAWRLVPTHFGGYPWDTKVDTTALARSVGPATGSAPTIAAEESDSLNVDIATIAPDTSTAAADSAHALAVTSADDSMATDHLTEAAARLPIADTTGIDEPVAFVPLPVSKVLIRNSPLTYVDQIRTPLLIIHGDNDLRTGVGQSEVLYKSLKLLERPVEYVRYPGSGHDLSRSGDPQLRMDRILRIYEFMERFIR